MDVHRCSARRRLDMPGSSIDRRAAVRVKFHLKVLVVGTRFGALIIACIRLQKAPDTMLVSLS